MGKQDSSKTRVVPVFDALFARDKTGASWVDSIVALGSRPEVVDTIRKGQRLIPSHERTWGKNEAKLAAPTSLLEYLVRHIDLKQVEASGDAGETRKKRTELANQHEETIAEALGKLEKGKRGRKWFVLEGESRPDALLETDEAVICIEGKRTEAGCTTHTTWMRCRSQLIRHMDAACDSFSGKRILGLLIVEGAGGADAVTPTQHWFEQCANQHVPTMIDGSLPHRNEEERRKIADGVLGVTTWQAVCKAHNLSWPPVPNVI